MFEIRGRPVGVTPPVVVGRIDGAVEIPMRDYDETKRVVKQLRPSPDSLAKKGGG